MSTGFSTINTPNTRVGSVYTNTNISANNIKHEHSQQKQPEASNKVKAGVMATTVLGMCTGLALSLKRGGFSANPIKILKDIKESGLAKVSYDAPEIMMIAAGSITGGLAGGILFDDKRNRRAKLREAFVQMFANISIPLGCVLFGTSLYKNKLEAPLLTKLKAVTKEGLPDVKGKVAGWLNVLTTAVCLTSAIFAGNKFSNIVNEKVYNIRDDRKVKLADMSGHVDDTCIAITTGFGENSFSQAISRIVPIALLVCGFETGTKQEWSDDEKAKRKVDPNKPQL